MPDDDDKRQPIPFTIDVTVDRTRVHRCPARRRSWIKSSQFGPIFMTSFMAQTLGESISSKMSIEVAYAAYYTAMYLIQDTRQVGSVAHGARFLV